VYSPFGELIARDGDAELDRYGFSTKWGDVDTGTRYYGYRFYSAELGRWLSRDSVEETGGINLFGYALNCPLTRYDLLGMASKSTDPSKNWIVSTSSSLERRENSYGETIVVSWLPSAVVSPCERTGEYKLSTGGRLVLQSIYSEEKTRIHEGVHRTRWTAAWKDFEKHAVSLERCYCNKETADCFADVIRKEMSAYYKVVGHKANLAWEIESYPEGAAKESYKEDMQKLEQLGVLTQLENAMKTAIRRCAGLPALPSKR
jgi:RHS repeat-associated protein